MAVLAAAGGGGCSKPPEKVVTSCVISFESDKPTQCFEYSSEPDKKTVLAERCKQFEGKTSYHEAPCPTEGRGGTCVTRIGGTENVMRCYRDTDSCRKSCDGAGTAFTPN